jgi:hypothetical protein
MVLTFNQIDSIFKSYGLSSHTIKKGFCTEYAFKNRFLRDRKSNVATQVKSLKNGGVGGYIYVDHLDEFKEHPNKTKMGHIHIGEMAEHELRSLIEKVIKDYR